MTWTLKLVVVTVLSVSTLMGLWFGTDFNMTVCFLTACVVAGLALWGLPRKQAAEEIVLAAGVTQAELDATVAICRQSGQRFQELAERVPEPEIRDMVREIADISLHIADNFIQDPADLRQARDFIYHLGRAVQLIENYVRHSGQRHLSDDEAAVLRQTEGQIAHIRDAFHTHLRNFRADNIRQLAIGGKALGDILRLEAPSIPVTRRS